MSTREAADVSKQRSSVRCWMTRRWMLRYFDGRGAPMWERWVRPHLMWCPSCRARYQQHLRLCQIDPFAPTQVERISASIGLRPTRHAGWAAAFAGAAAIVVAGVLVVGLRADESPFAARGDAAGLAGATAFHVYRQADGRVAPARSPVPRDVELLFSYRNPSAKPYLMIFGRDEARRVHWYYPAWQNPAQDPSAVGIASGPELRPLSDAIRHPLRGQRLELTALFCDERRTVRKMEAYLRRYHGRHLRPPKDCLLRNEVLELVAAASGEGQ